MTQDQLATAKLNKEKIIKLYTAQRNQTLDKLGYVLEHELNMTQWTKKAVNVFFNRKNIEVTWDEACQIFE